MGNHNRTKAKPTRRADDDTIEIVRSFSMKRNLQNHLGPAFAYESVDYFASAKKACKPADAEKTSDQLYAFAKAEVLKSIRACEAELREMGSSLQIGKPEHVHHAAASNARAFEVAQAKKVNGAQ